MRRPPPGGGGIGRPVALRGGVAGADGCRGRGSARAGPERCRCGSVPVRQVRSAPAAAARGGCGGCGSLGRSAGAPVRAPARVQQAQRVHGCGPRRGRGADVGDDTGGTHDAVRRGGGLLGRDLVVGDRCRCGRRARARPLGCSSTTGARPRAWPWPALGLGFGLGLRRRWARGAAPRRRPDGGRDRQRGRRCSTSGSSRRS